MAANFVPFASLDNGVEVEKRGPDARLGEIELVDLRTDVVGDVASGGDVGDDVVGVGLYVVRNLGGLAKGGELLVEVGALGKEVVEVQI
ncbi:unnamed protein product [Malus baccata var. baccata]